MFRERRLSPAAAIVGCLTVFLSHSTVGHANVTRIVIDTVTSPAFDGEAYGDIGQYETIEGR
ncbi:MAG: hypothetical protein OEM78_11175, partial [Gammaproteobacteria bacterium]|nr:hypothetical protein [Gammaproteobacteria bacterium]